MDELVWCCEKCGSGAGGNIRRKGAICSRCWQRAYYHRTKKLRRPVVREAEQFWPPGPAPTASSPGPMCGDCEHRPCRCTDDDYDLGLRLLADHDDERSPVCLRPFTLPLPAQRR